jgi:hypothetical protein
VSSGRSARILCKKDSFWITPRQFWQLVQQGIVTYLHELPLTAQYRGRKEDFLVTSNHVILNLACQEHRSSFFEAKKHKRRKR